MTTSSADPQRFVSLQDRFEGDIPVVAALRGPYVGSLHRGIWCVADIRGHEIMAGGDASQRVFVRSAAKPFQAMPAVLCGAVHQAGLTGPEVAVLCASHHGEPHHVEAVLSVLRKSGLEEGALRCGAHPPIAPAAAAELNRRGRQPTAVFNNCSGAHAGMLLACRYMGWNLENYGSADHPLQVQTREILAQFCGLPVTEIEWALDNCAVPAFRIPLRSAATAFARLACPEELPSDLHAAAECIFSAMTSNPALVGGSDSFDTRLMRAFSGDLVSKGGAEGFQGLGLARQRLGIAVKISDGAARAVPPTSLSVLRRLGTFPRSRSDALAADTAPEVRNALGEVVGSLVPVSYTGDA